MEKIKEVIVVEGANDTKVLKTYFDVETIETHGLGLSKDTLELIRKINEARGVIVFTDPDSPGETIRRKINANIKGLKNAFILKEDARTKKKVGVEHATYEALKEALDNLVSYEEFKNTLSWSEFIELGLIGLSDSASRREKISKEYHLGICNAKTLFKRINLLGLKKEDLCHEHQ